MMKQHDKKDVFELKNIFITVIVITDLTRMNSRNEFQKRIPETNSRNESFLK